MPRTQIGASVQLSSTVRCGNKLNCWNTMPTSRRTSSMARRSSVSSRPSTTTRPCCQSSMRLMQRSSVDLPLPEGPLITMRSPRITFRFTSRSTWKAPNHLFRPAISIATSLRVVRMAGAPPSVDTGGRVAGFCALLSMDLLARSPHVQSPLGVERISRHGKAESKIDHAPESEAGEQRSRRGPVRIRKSCAQLAEQVEDRDDQNERRILEQRNEGIDDAGNHEL